MLMFSHHDILFITGCRFRTFVSVVTWLGSGWVIEVPQVLIGMLNVVPVVALPDCRYLDRGKGAVNTG